MPIENQLRGFCYEKQKPSKECQDSLEGSARILSGRLIHGTPQKEKTSCLLVCGVFWYVKYHVGRDSFKSQTKSPFLR
jgi:hypothetical protein